MGNSPCDLQRDSQSLQVLFYVRTYVDKVKNGIGLIVPIPFRLLTIPFHIRTAYRGPQRARKLLFFTLRFDEFAELDDALLAEPFAILGVARDGWKAEEGVVGGDGSRQALACLGDPFVVSYLVEQIPSCVHQVDEFIDAHDIQLDIKVNQKDSLEFCLTNRPLRGYYKQSKGIADCSSLTENHLLPSRLSS